MGSCRARSVYLTTRLLGRLRSSRRLTSIVHILSPETDNCPSWISRRERMTVEKISWSISMKECCRPQWGLNPWPPGLQSDGDQEVVGSTPTEVGNILSWRLIMKFFSTIIMHNIYFSREMRKISALFGWKNCLIWSSAKDSNLPRKIKIAHTPQPLYNTIVGSIA